MTDRLPGTTFEIGSITRDCAQEVFRTMFAGGGLMLSQVSQLTGLEPHVVQNWVKRGFLSPPKHKQYSKDQFCRIAIINMLRESLHMEDICRLMSYLNGKLNDESDDRMCDSDIYNLYCNLLSALEGEPMTDVLLGTEVSRVTEETVADPTTKSRLKTVLSVMALAHRASELRRAAELKLCDIEE